MADEAGCQTATEAIEESPTNGTHTAAVKMMNVHKCSSYITLFLRTGVEYPNRYLPYSRN
ncbi:MAG: hypothetical protein KME05_06650 [Gloeocapsa sp. UFS-A4-WI-NPMV-4B04]|nr:hypothetical protein [Gloeocapsa sp. UFS-A4-WI-NPMV-4B04]